ncbi:MAG: secondary thiamine-phosphate synthase enzyme YjbQ [Planctomycetota bacterium]
MKIVESSFGVSSKKRCEMIDITRKISEAVAESGITSGEVTVYTPHTTAAVTINENADPSVVHDILLVLNEMIPESRPGYRHYEGNSDSHVKSSLIGCSEHVLISKRSLVLGTWQGIYFCEFDGPRSRKVMLQIRGE